MVSEERDENYPKGVSPESFIGVQFRFRLDSRLKHAGMTVFIKNSLNTANRGELGPQRFNSVSLFNFELSLQTALDIYPSIGVLSF